MALKDAPTQLQPYLFHGVALDYRGSREPVGDCPFCGKTGKFYVARETGMFSCKAGSCDQNGNLYDFIRLLHEASVDVRTQEWLDELSEQRGISAQFLDEWGIAPSIITSEVIVPGYSIKGKLTNLYHWLMNADTGKKILYSTPTLRHGIFGMANWDASKENVVIAEGPWTGSAVHQIFSSVSCNGDLFEGGTIAPMFNRGNSLETGWNIIGVPGCNNFRDVWSELFKDLNVCIMLDNDYSKEGNDRRMRAGAGWKGTIRTAKILREADHNPKRIYGLQWGGQGHSEDFKDGYDLRDALIDHGSNGDIRVKAPKAACAALKSVLGYLTPLDKTGDSEAPSESNGNGHESPRKKGKSNLELAPTHCETFKDVRNEWRKAFKWTDQLDMSLATMLAVAASTSLPGSAQCWLRLIGPPGCIDADTLIYDPMDETTLTVKDRYERGTAFHVYSKELDGSVHIRWAYPPVKCGPADMYEVTFSSGKTICVTGGHRFWDGKSYPTLLTLLDKSERGEVCELPGSDGISKTPDVTIVAIRYLEKREYYDFNVPLTSNYLACGVFHHNSGKSSFCEALSVSGKYVFPLSMQKGFHSGARDRETGETCSLIPHMDKKTVIIKDGDTLLNGPNRDQSLAELRDIYDGTSRARYRNSNDAQNYTGLRITFILAGTKSLKRMNRSFLGDRFLDCVIYEKGDDPDLEANILKRSARNALRQMKMDDLSVDAVNDDRMILAMNITAGYLHYLRENIEWLANEVTVSDDVLTECIALGELTSYMRARPDKELEEEDDEVELATRLTAQYVRLSTCLAVTLNRQEVDDSVMRVVRKVAHDTSRGVTFSICRKLAKYPAGLEAKTLSAFLHKPTQRINSACRFLEGIGVTHRDPKKRASKSNLWFIEERIGQLVNLVNG